MNYFVYYAGISLPGGQREQVTAHVHPGRHHHHLQQRQVYLLVPRGARPSPGQSTEQHVCVCMSQVNVLFITNMILKTNRWKCSRG